MRGHRLTEREWRVFRRVARARLKRGEEVLPDLIGCPSFGQSVWEVAEDRYTARLLLRSGVSALDYVRIGWTVLVASDPDSFGLGGDPVVRANASFLDSRRGEVQALLHPREGGGG